MIKQQIKNIITRFAPDIILKPLMVHHYCQSLNNFNDELEPDIFVLRKIVKKNSLVIDIGANYGLYTKILSELVGENGKVIAFEPIPFTHSILTNVIKTLHLNNVKAECIALANYSGKATMLIPKFDGGNTNYYQASLNNHKNSADTKSIEVEVQKLDQYLESIGTQENLALIKIDAEGAEYEVLKGGEKNLTKFEPILLIEVAGASSNMNPVAHNLFSFLDSLGYTAFYTKNGSLHKWNKEEKILNFFFLSASHIQELEISEQ